MVDRIITNQVTYIGEIWAVKPWPTKNKSERFTKDIYSDNLPVNKFNINFIVRGYYNH